jgi:hypothetical protein
MNSGLYICEAGVLLLGSHLPVPFALNVFLEMGVL